METGQGRGSAASCVEAGLPRLSQLSELATSDGRKWGLPPYRGACWKPGLPSPRLPGVRAGWRGPSSYWGEAGLEVPMGWAPQPPVD